jgi:hypothetical protein
MPLMRRRPVLRAAAVGGGAYVAGKKRQQAREREAEQEARLGDLEAQQQSAAGAPAQPAPVAVAGGMSPDAIERLKELGQLRDQGILTEEEFAVQKARLLGG